MQRKKIIMPVLVVVGALLVLIFLFSIFGGSDDVDWSENYEPKSKDPYGTHVLQNYLGTKAESFSFLDEKFAEHEWDEPGIT